MLKLYKLNFDCGRDYLHGIFVAEEDQVNELIASGRTVGYGEALGKHSEVYGPLNAEDIEEVAADPEFIQKFKDLGLDIYNPFDYINEE